MLPMVFAVLWLSRAPTAPASGPEEDKKARAEQLLHEAERIAEDRDFALVEADLDAALEISREVRDRRLEARCLASLGNLSHSRGDFAAGHALRLRALDLAREAGDRSLVAMILTEIGHGYYMQADYGQALRYDADALAIESEIGDQIGEAVTRRRIGQVYFKQGQYDRALESYSRALQLAEDAENLTVQSRVLESIGNLYRDKNLNARAIDYYQRALRNYEALDDRRGQGSMYISIGLSYCFQDAYQEALSYFRIALQLAEEGKDLSGRASALRHLGLIYGQQGESAKAIECYEQYLQYRQQVGDRREEAWALAGIAEVHRVHGDIARSLEFHKRAEKIWEEIGDRRALTDDIRITGDLYLHLGDYASAKQSYIRARDLGEEIHLPYLSLTLGNLGRVHAMLGEAQQALTYGQQAIEDSRQTGNEGMRWVAAYRMGTIQRQLGMPDQALRSFRESLAVIEDLRTGTSPEDEARSGFLEDKQIVYAETIDLLIELGRAREALELAERARARAFLDLLRAKELQGRPQGAPPEALSSRRPPQTQVADPAAGEMAGIELRGPVPDRAENGELRTMGVELARTIEAQPPSIVELLEDAQRRDTTIVEYFATEQKLFTWVLSPGGDLHFAALGISDHELDSLVREMRGAMHADDGERDATEWRGSASMAVSPRQGGITDRDPRPVLRRLYRLLIQPVEQWLPNDPGSLVTIVPHGPLFLVSFAALLDRNDRYLIERHTIHYGPAMSVLRYTAADKTRVVHRDAPHLFVVGNPAMPRVPWANRSFPPLPGAEAEARAIGRLFPPERLTALTGAKAWESRVRELAVDQTIIHFATHCVIRDDLPLESFLALAPTPSDDGRLTAREVFDMDLRADLVVLSACNTGLGKVNGDGVIGLSRAFIAAGTSSVAVSLWPVADVVATSEMESFYASLRANRGDKAAALRAAQLETIRKLRRKELRTPAGSVVPEHPMYWAPFVLIGEAS